MKYSSLDYSLRDNLNVVNTSGYQGEKGRPKAHPRVYIGRFEEANKDASYGVNLMQGRQGMLVSGEQAKRKVAPEFASDAKVAVSFVDDENKDIGRAVQLDFPRAEERGGCRVFDYEVTATLVEDDVDLVQVQRRFIAPDFFLPLESKIPSCRFRLALSDLKLKGHYRFGVTPVESFGKKGRTIWSETVEIKADNS